MTQNSRNPRTLGILIVGGIVLIASGFIALIVSSGGRFTPIVVLPAIAFVVGAVAVKKAVVRRKASLFRFLATFLLLAAFLLSFLASGLVPGSLARFWPLLPVCAGVALAVAGGNARFRSRYLVPAVAFVVLGLSLLPFSLNLAAVGLRAFFLEWWPLLFILIGAALSLLSLASGPSSREDPQP